MKKLLTSLFAFTLICGGGIALSACGQQEPLECEFKVAQIGEEQKINVTWDCEENLSQIKILVTHENTVVSKYTVKGEQALRDGSHEIYAYYGKQKVEVQAESYSGKSVSFNQEISLSASEYNLAPLSGSMPVLMFTLSALKDNGLTETESGKTIPTFVWLDRSGAWNWDKLPENVYPIPTATRPEYTTPNVNRNLMYNKTNAYIQELSEINPESKFNLYLNDYDTDQYLKMLVANGIPETNYTCTYISDGAFSYSIINNTFNVENATEKYNTMLEKYNTTKEQVKERKYYSYDSGFEVVGKDLRPYLLVLANEDPNVRWWFPRLRTEHIKLDKDTSNFVQNKIFSSGSTLVSPNIKEYGINTLLTAIQADGTKVAELKALYRFNDDMFAEAKAQNKKAMMLLGSWAGNTPEANFVEYANFVKKYYGDEYVYYYKGHPNTPTAMYPDRAELLNEMGLIDLESTIAAELILFFFPDIYMSGYSSSTFTSLQNKEMACAFWGQTKAQAIAIANQNGDMFDVYISHPSAHGNKYDEFMTNPEHKYYIVEFNDTSKHEFAIYDSTANTITYYNADNEVVA